MAESNIILRLVLAALWVCMLVVAVLGYTGTFGASLAKAAKLNNTALTPADYTFYSLAIIGVLQGLGCLYALFPYGYSGERADGWKKKSVDAVGPWWIIGFVAEILWFGLWTQDYGATKIISLLLQVAGLLSFAIAYGLLMNMTAGHSKELGRSVSLPSYLFFYVPTAMNLAWLTVGTCIGLMTIISTYAQEYSAKNGIQILATLLVAAVTFVGLLIEGFHASIFYGLTLIWAISGTYVAKKDEKEYAIMEQGLLVCLVLLVLATFISIVVSVFKFCRPPATGEQLLAADEGDDAPKEEGGPVLV